MHDTRRSCSPSLLSFDLSSLQTSKVCPYMSYVVDDSDPRILYSDGWEIANPPLAYHSTLHVAAKAGLTATFNFTGK